MTAVIGLSSDNLGAASSSVASAFASSPSVTKVQGPDSLLPDGRPSFPYGPPFGAGELFWNITSEHGDVFREYNMSSESDKSVQTLLLPFPLVCNATSTAQGEDANPEKTHACCQHAGGLFEGGYGCRLSSLGGDSDEMHASFDLCSRNHTGGRALVCEDFDHAFLRAFGNVEASIDWDKYRDQVNNATDGSGTVLCTKFGGRPGTFSHCCMDPQRAKKDADDAPGSTVPCAVKNNNESLTDFRRCLLKQDAYPVCLPRSLPINADIVRNPPKEGSSALPGADSTRGAVAAATVAVLALASFVTM